jgi:hypothetical protein
MMDLVAEGSDLRAHYMSQGQMKFKGVERNKGCVNQFQQ